MDDGSLVPQGMPRPKFLRRADRGAVLQGAPLLIKKIIKDVVKYNQENGGAEEAQSPATTQPFQQGR